MTIIEARTAIETCRRCRRLPCECPPSVKAGKRIAGNVFTQQLLTGETVIWWVDVMNDDCFAGRFGTPIPVPISAVPPADWTTGNLNRPRIDELKRTPSELYIPCIAIAAPVPNELCCICDGQHRVTAFQEMGLFAFLCFIIPWPDQFRYRVERNPE